MKQTTIDTPGNHKIQDLRPLFVTECQGGA